MAGITPSADEIKAAPPEMRRSIAQEMHRPSGRTATVRRASSGWLQRGQARNNLHFGAAICQWPAFSLSWGARQQACR